jgi:trehalose utilization protein
MNHNKSVLFATDGISRRDALVAGTTVVTSLCLGNLLQAAERRRRVVVWSEGTAPEDKVYPKDVNTAMADGIKKHLRDWIVETASLADPEQGCSEASLNQCDVLVWWGHKKHDEVKDEYVDRIVRRVKEQGMGFIAVHSSHFAKPNKKLMGTECSWGAYKTDGCKLKVKIKEPTHPIAAGVREYTLPMIERYSEPYKVPTPESVPFDGTYIYPDGKEESVRVGLCWNIGKARMFYFVPGHETYRDLYFEETQLILANAVKWAAPKA